MCIFNKYISKKTFLCFEIILLSLFLKNISKSIIIIFKAQEMKNKCDHKHLTFVCPKQFYCAKNECIMCSRPACSTKDDFENTKKVIDEFRDKKIKKINGGL